ncbi:MAG: hypothetical protein MJY82_07470 [Fibrobacter sp.]|nr:hypothetical protein [Fibrobacter sp.]
MNKKYLLAVSACTFILAACGDDVTEVTKVYEDGMAVLEAGEKLSEQVCDTTNVGEMLFVTDSSKAFVCDGESWQTMKGAQGEAGDKGAKGEAGEKGDKGDTGKTGTQGDKGEKGDQGETGLKGDDGDKGATGKQGSTGATGAAGTAGASCTVADTTDAETNLKGFKLICADTLAGVVWNGEKGDDGKLPGTDGVGCSINDEGDGAVTLTCADAEPVALYKAVCGTKPYDPAYNACCGFEVYDPAYSFCSKGELYSCNGEPYDPEKQYCLEVTRDGDKRYSVEALLTDSRDEQNIQVYKTVKICNDDETSCQIWMAENLNYSVNPGERSWCGGGSGSTEGDCNLYGRLYTWAAAVAKTEVECGHGKKCNLPSGNIRGVCPENWHLPDTTEWKTLFAAVGGADVAGKMLKSASGWNDNEGSSGNGLDFFGFAALPSGYRSSGGSFSNKGVYANFWSSSEHGSVNSWAYNKFLSNDEENVVDNTGDKSSGFSVRCVKD